MAPGSRPNLISVAAERLQAAYGQQRVAARARFQVLDAAGAFKAPAHLVPALRGELDLGMRAPLQADQVRAEAA